MSMILIERAVVKELLSLHDAKVDVASPWDAAFEALRGALAQQPAQEPERELKWCAACGEGYHGFCRSHSGLDCPMENRHRAGSAGYVTVPVEPTKEMLQAGSDDLQSAGCTGTLVRASECYRAMLKASPRQAQQSGGISADWKFVPLNPTSAMRLAAENAYYLAGKGLGRFQRDVAAYRAAINAAPPMNLPVEAAHGIGATK